MQEYSVTINELLSFVITNVLRCPQSVHFAEWYRFLQSKLDGDEVKEGWYAIST